MHLWLKRAIGAAGIAVGFLLWQGSPAGASELVKDPLASAAKSGNAAGVAALGDVAGKAISDELGDVKASASIQATSGTENSGNSGGAAIKSNITFGDSKVHITAHASGWRIDAEQQHLVPQSASIDASARLGARLPAAKLLQPEATVNRSEGMAKSLVAKATKSIAQGPKDLPKASCALACKQLAEDQGRLLEMLRDAADDVATWTSGKLAEVPCELEPEDLAQRARQHVDLKRLSQVTKYTSKGGAAFQKCLRGTLDCDSLKKGWRHRRCS